MENQKQSGSGFLPHEMDVAVSTLHGNVSWLKRWWSGQSDEASHPWNAADGTTKV
jgi:phage-related minor tail protein